MAYKVKRKLTKFGVKIKKGLIDKGITQKELAEQIGIAERTIIEIIYGCRTEVHIKDRAFEILNIK